jgi:hypothetical protein
MHAFYAQIFIITYSFACLSTWLILGHCNTVPARRSSFSQSSKSPDLTNTERREALKVDLALDKLPDKEKVLFFLIFFYFISSLFNLNSACGSKIII